MRDAGNIADLTLLLGATYVLFRMIRGHWCAWKATWPSQAERRAALEENAATHLAMASYQRPWLIVAMALATATKLAVVVWQLVCGDGSPGQAIL